MSKNQRYFLGTLLVRNGHYEHSSNVLLVANTQKRAWDVLEKAASNFHGDEAPMEDGGYFFNAGEIYVRTTGVQEIGLAEFDAMKGHFPVERDANIANTPVEPADTLEGFKAFAASATRMLEKRGVEVSHSVMLDALAAALGQKNWQVLNARLSGAQSAPVQPTQTTPAPLKGPLQRQQELLEEIGFTFSPDADQPGLWVWTAPSDACDTSLSSLQDAVGDAWASASAQAKQAFQLHEAQWNGIGFERQQELLRKLGHQDGDAQDAQPAAPPGYFEVELCRTAYGFRKLMLLADNAQQASQRALEQAGDLLYDTKSAEYEVTSVVPFKYSKSRALRQQ